MEPEQLPLCEPTAATRRDPFRLHKIKGQKDARLGDRVSILVARDDIQEPEERGGVVTSVGQEILEAANLETGNPGRRRPYWIVTLDGRTIPEPPIYEGRSLRVLLRAPNPGT